MHTYHTSAIVFNLQIKDSLYTKWQLVQKFNCTLTFSKRESILRVIMSCRRSSPIFMMSLMGSVRKAVGLTLSISKKSGFFNGCIWNEMYRPEYNYVSNSYSQLKLQLNFPNKFFHTYRCYTCTCMQALTYHLIVLHTACRKPSNSTYIWDC